MAFAQNQNGNSLTAGANSPFLTEKDLIRQVASNITKESLIVSEKLQEKAAGDSKRLMAETMGKAQKVWQAFVKFVKNQVTVNGRLVDTQLIGLFCKDANGDVVYMPSRDYMEAGKFKLQRGQGSLVDRLGLAGSVDLLDAY